MIGRHDLAPNVALEAGVRTVIADGVRRRHAGQEERRRGTGRGVQDHSPHDRTSARLESAVGVRLQSWVPTVAWDLADETDFGAAAQAVGVDGGDDVAGEKESVHAASLRPGADIASTSH
jgi:hypothetical protein